MLQTYPKKIVIFRCLQLGDMLCMIPAVRALKSYYKQAQITLIGLPWAHEFAKRFSYYFDDFIPFPGFPGLPEQTYTKEQFSTFIDIVRSQSFDLAVQMHGNGSITNTIIDMFTADTLAGFCTKEKQRENFLPYPEHASEIRKLLDLVRFLGIPSKGEYLEFPLEEQEKNQGKEMLEKYQVEKKQYICINPSARDTQRRWHPFHFAKIADLAAEFGCTPMLIGSKKDAYISQAVASFMHQKFIDLTGKTSLGTLAYILQHACGLITNDTGISHVAAALQVKSIVIFTASDINRWAPLDSNLHKAIQPKFYKEVIPYVYELLGIRQQILL